MSKKFDLQVPEYSGKKFIWSRYKKLTGVGVVEASELGLKPGKVPHSQCYSDACDEGIKVKSHRTGKVIECYLSKETAAEWEYKSLCGKVTIIILND